MRAQHHIRSLGKAIMSFIAAVHHRAWNFRTRSLVWTPSGHVLETNPGCGPSYLPPTSNSSLWLRFTPGTRCDSAIATFTMTIVSVPRATRSTSSTGRAAIAAAPGAYTARGWSRRPSRPHSPASEPAPLPRGLASAQVIPSVRALLHLRVLLYTTLVRRRI